MTASWRSIAVPAAILVLWELPPASGLVDLEFISRPSHILIAGDIRPRRRLVPLCDLADARSPCLFGIAIALVVGVLVGIFLGLSPFAELVSRPSLEALRSIPSIAFAPLSLLLFGFGLPMEGMIVAYACLWPILITTISAVRNIEPRLIEIAAALEMSAVQRVQKIIIPAVLSRVLVGLRTAAGFALVVAVTVEILINPRGLGYGLIIAQQSLRIDVMYAYLLWLAVLGLLVNALVRLADREVAA